MSTNGWRGGGGGANCGRVDSTGFPEVGTWEDIAGAGSAGSNNRKEQDEEEEGVLPPLRRPHVHQIPADVLATIIKEIPKSTNQFEPYQKNMTNSQNSQNPPCHNVQNAQHQPMQYSTRQNLQNPLRQNQSIRYAQHQNVSPSLSQSMQTPPRQNMRHQNVSSYQDQDPRQNANAINSSCEVTHLRGEASGHSSCQPKAKKALSASAREFVPTMSPPSTMPSTMSSTETNDLAQAIAEFQLQNQPQDEGPNDDQFYVEDSSDFVLSAITDAISDLTANPANFKRCAKSVTDVLKNYCTDVDTLGIVVALITEQCVSNPNFCYSGARLIDTLIKNEITVNNIKFQGMLLTRCQEEFKACKNSKSSDPASIQRCRGLLLYCGELFMNVKLTNRSGVSAPIIPLGLGAIELMQKLVKEPTYENIKCIFQVLKLVGWDIEKLSDAKIKEAFEQLLKDLSYLCLASDEVSPETKQLLDILFELKNKKWNHVTDAGSDTKSCSSSTSGQSSYFYELPDSDDDDEDCILLDDEPAEVRLAYEDFLKTANM